MIMLERERERKREREREQQEGEGERRGSWMSASTAKHSSLIIQMHTLMKEGERGRARVRVRETEREKRWKSSRAFGMSLPMDH